MLLSARIVLARERKNLTQEELARRLGVSKREIQRWEAGETVLQGQNRLALMRELAIYGFTSKQETPPMSEKQNTPHTYFVQDRKDYERLTPQGHMTTLMLGGLMPDQASPEQFHRVLDVACGTGGWLIECAMRYPLMHTLEGVDISSETLAFAQKQVEEAGVGDRVHLQKMDALHALEFPDGYFDLVNLRYAVGWIRIWDWAKMILEMQRVLRKGGTLRITEVQYIKSDALWLNRYWGMGLEAARNAGYLTPQITHITELLPGYLQAAQFSEVQCRVTPAVYKHGTPEHELFAANLKNLLPKTEKYLKTWINVDASLKAWHVVDYQHFMAKIIGELESEDFVCDQPIETVWAKK